MDEPTKPSEPVTSEPVTSEPVTSEPVTSENKSYLQRFFEYFTPKKSDTLPNGKRPTGGRKHKKSSKQHKKGSKKGTRKQRKNTSHK
jgi:hypothetical protein